MNSSENDAAHYGHDHLFLFLLAGLDFAAQREKEVGAGGLPRSLYPYPDTLRIAWNALSYHSMAQEGGSIPRTLSGLLKRCTQPVSQWLSPSLIPSDFPAQAPLLYPGSEIELSDSAEEFLNDHLFNDPDFTKSKIRDASQLQRFVENQKFVELLKRLRSKSWSPALQAEYVKLRRFLIEHPYTTRAKIAHTFATQSTLSPADVGNLYATCYPQEVYYRCEKCGLLRTSVNNRHVGAKPDFCSDHAADAPHIHRVPWEDGLCRLYPGIHNRIALHGIAEVAIFDRLHFLQEKYPKRIYAVEEWADIDRYDLRIVFADGVAWAVDVKDFADPHRLSSELKAIAVCGDYAHFDRAFYVIPQRRLTANPNYLRDARAGADKLPASYDLCDDDSFVALAETYRPKKETRS